MQSTPEITQQVHQWLNENWDPEADLVQWRTLLAESGWGAAHWPKDYFGKGLSAEVSAAIEDVFADFGAVGTAQTGVRMLAVNVSRPTENRHVFLRSSASRTI